MSSQTLISVTVLVIAVILVLCICDHVLPGAHISYCASDSGSLILVSELCMYDLYVTMAPRPQIRLLCD